MALAATSDQDSRYTLWWGRGIYMNVNGLGNTRNESSMVPALREVVVATAVTQPKDSTMLNTEDTPTKEL